ncbi:MAG: hypothetical protein MUF73_10015 [Rhodobacteraceae bacterium]|jgi:hypothetical protein|nr:hypothetical protein [Paracoccaceae bacterium]
MLRMLFRSGGRRPRLVMLGLAFFGLAAVLAVTQPGTPPAPPAPVPTEGATAGQP